MITNTMMKVLEGFHHRVDRWIVEMMARRGDVGEWEWDLVEAALEAAWIWTMRDYVRRWKASTEEYVTDQPIYELCTGAERMEESSRFIRWQDQDNGTTQAEREVGLNIDSV